MNTFQIRITLAIMLLLTCSVSTAQIVRNENYALIFPKTGDGFTGNILRIDQDTLIVFTNDYKYIAKKDIGKIIFHAKKESGNGFAIGSIFGMYIMNYWLGTANNQPGGFLWDRMYGSRYADNTSYYTETPFGILGTAALGIAIGGGIGYIVDANRESNSEMTFLFGGSPQLQEEQWDKAKEVIEHKMRKPKFHLSISGGNVFSSVAGSYYDQLKDAGYNTSSYNDYYYYSPSNTGSNFSQFQNLQGASDFNWLRSISLSYTVADHIRAGLLYAVLSEPSFALYKTIYLNSGNGTSQTNRAGQRLEAKGYYVTAGYEQRFGTNDNFEFTFTGGIGLANIRFDLNGESYFDSSYKTINDQTDNISIRRSNISAMISGSVSYYLYESFSMGIIANYFFAGSETARAMPVALLNEQKLNFGNADIGFVLGLHF
jgi:hypothetical protein